MASKDPETVKVVVRCRPMNKKEIEDQMKVCLGKVDVAKDEALSLVAKRKECQAGMAEVRKLADAVYREALIKRRKRLQACLDKFEGGEMQETGVFAVSVPLLLAEVDCMEKEEKVLNSRYD